MSELAELQEKLQDTSAALARAERALADQPGLPSVLATLKSLQKRQHDLEEDFLSQAARLQIDVCSYRLFSESGRPSVRWLATALTDFQSLFSLVYDSLKHGPKQRGRLSADAAQETEFGFAYTFPGSVGVVMTLPNDALLLGETKLDEAILTIAEMTKLKTSDQLSVYAKKLGLPPIRAIYRWASDLIEADLGADVEWRRRDTVRASLFLQRPELETLKQAIEHTSEKAEEEFDVVGDLVGVDVTGRSFHMKIPDREDIRGSFRDAISSQHTVEVPKRYKAKIRKTTTVYYATEEESVVHFLVRLSPT